MYAGHFAFAAVLRAREPTVPLWCVLIGVGLLDILFAPFVLLGIDRVSLNPSSPIGMSLDSIDWSHSLLMTVVWSLLYGGAFLRWGRRAATVAGVAAFSHFPMDVVMHAPDLALWPGSRTRLGLGMWYAMPVGWWFFELAVILAGCTYYVWRTRRTPSAPGRRVMAVALVIVALHVINSPWITGATLAKATAGS
jgi:hypothetical protein